MENCYVTASEAMIRLGVDEDQLIAYVNWGATNPYTKDHFFLEAELNQEGDPIFDLEGLYWFADEISFDPQITKAALRRAKRQKRKESLTKGDLIAEMLLMQITDYIVENNLDTNSLGQIDQ